MFLRSTNRKKDGKDHRYFSVVENRRLSSGKTAQRTVLYLGEVNDKQEAAWRKSLEVFDEQRQCSRTMSLFPEDRTIPGDAVDSLQVKLSGLQLKRPRAFGNCWLACNLWQQLGLEEFWQRRLPDGREAVSWEKVLQLLVVNRLIDPASEFRVHRQWFLTTALDELMGVDYAVAEKDRLYRCLDRLLEHKQDLFVWLKQKRADLFQADFEVLLYDLTSTYFEGAFPAGPERLRRLQGHCDHHTVRTVSPNTGCDSCSPSGHVRSRPLRLYSKSALDYLPDADRSSFGYERRSIMVRNWPRRPAHPGQPLVGPPARGPECSRRVRPRGRLWPPRPAQRLSNRS